jgi:hypothetical protein
MEDDEAHTVDLPNIDGSTITITIPKEPSIGDVWLDTSSMDVNVFSGNHDWITITGDSGSIDLNNITIVEPVEFEDQMPSVAKIEDMCKEYPGLEKAYENFKTVYKMVHQHWRGKQDSDEDTLF